MAASIKERDLGWKRIEKSLKARGQPTAVRVGYFSPKGEEKPKGATNTLIAAVHEYGSPKKNIPERPFMRRTFDQYAKKYKKQIREFGEKLAIGKSTPTIELNLLGESYRADIVLGITRRSISPALEELSEKTIARRPKLDDLPLFDTGQMIGALNVELEK